MFNDSTEMRKELLLHSQNIAIETQTLFQTIALNSKETNSSAKLNSLFLSMEEELLKLKEYEMWWMSVKKEEERIASGNALLQSLGS